MPHNCQKLFDTLTSREFLDYLSSIMGFKIMNDLTKKLVGYTQI